MKYFSSSYVVLAALAAALFGLPSLGHASTCVGNCGTATGADGNIAAPPGGGTYGWVSTFGGQFGAGQIASVGGTDGSEFLSDSFTATAGDVLDFSFNYITADGTGSFPDYGFAELLSGTTHVAYLFTARTVAGSGDTSPGFGLPANDSTLTPMNTPITPGATNWSPLGPSSGGCYGGSGQGCGSTGWINSTYSVLANGTYTIKFGATNYGDTAVDSGLAFAGLKIAGNPIPIGAAPEPATWAIMMFGLGVVGMRLRGAKRRNTQPAFAAA